MEIREANQERAQRSPRRPLPPECSDLIPTRIVMNGQRLSPESAAPAPPGMVDWTLSPRTGSDQILRLCDPIPQPEAEGRVTFGNREDAEKMVSSPCPPPRRPRGCAHREGSVRRICRIRFLPKQKRISGEADNTGACAQRLVGRPRARQSQSSRGCSIADLRARSTDLVDLRARLVDLAQPPDRWRGVLEGSGARPTPTSRYVLADQAVPVASTGCHKSDSRNQNKNWYVNIDGYSNYGCVTWVQLMHSLDLTKRHSSREPRVARYGYWCYTVLVKLN